MEQLAGFSSYPDLVATLADRALELADGAIGRRVVIGIVGAPGVGKSTVTDALAAAINSSIPTAVVPMDGFHLSNAELERLGRRQRKGAPDTFDVAGYASLLHRVRHEDGPIWAPRFHREIEESIAAEVVIESTTKVIVTEGNYLLTEGFGWDRVRHLLDAAWYLEPTDDADRRARLVHRHQSHGRSPDEAEAWVQSSDDLNARLIATTRSAADVVVHLPVFTIVR